MGEATILGSDCFAGFPRVLELFTDGKATIQKEICYAMNWSFFLKKVVGYQLYTFSAIHDTFLRRMTWGGQFSGWWQGRGKQELELKMVAERKLTS